MSRSRSVFRQPGSQHFQVLHRSLRDPLANDENASQHVLSEVSRRGEPSSSSTSRKTNTAAEEEAEHGILYGDDYDYLQHLRTIGTEREAVFVTAETQQNKKSQQPPHRTVDGIALPPEALPAEGQERDYAEMMGIPDRPFGLQPEMDPKVREVLEALDDDAYVGQEDDRREEDFFETLMGEDEDGNDDPLESGASGLVEQEDERTDWERHMDQFKVAKPAATASDSEDELEDDGSEAGDTIAELRQSSAQRKPRAAGTGTGTGTAQDSAFSMSSSAMFRNEGLRTLDDRFDHLEQEYEDDSLSEEDSDDDDQPVDLGEKRPDLSSILDDFLSRHQYVGGAHTASLPNDATRYRELDDLRAQLRDVDLDKHTDNNKAYILQRAAQLDELDQRGKHEKSTQVAVDDGAAGPADRWDCQTILSTRTNLENHPKMIRLNGVSNKKRSAKEQAPQQAGQEEPRRIVLDPKTGFPSLAESLPPQPAAPTTAASDQASSSSSSHSDPEEGEVEQGPAPGVLARSRRETKEEKKARKQAVKGDRANRRAEKKGHKDLFNAEVARQKGLQSRSNKADRQIGQRGVVALS